MPLPERIDNFTRAVEVVLSEEGGYVNDPDDPGGETNFGISKRSYPGVDIRGLTREAAAAIYRLDYWNPLDLNQVDHYGSALVIFDCAVNQGTGRARVLEAKVRQFKGPEFVASFQAERALAYAGLANWPKYGRGWMRRLIRVSMAAATGPA